MCIKNIEKKLAKILFFATINIPNDGARWNLSV
jgi:hypothetical protein